MIYSKRKLESRLFNAFEDPFVTGILGPRRVGKSTLIQHFIDTHPDIDVIQFNMDHMDERDQVRSGKLEAMILMAAKRHLTAEKKLWVAIDEAQKCPELFEQVKILYDQNKDKDTIKFIITGSALLELHRLSAESLAGRIQLYHLSAFGLAETAARHTQINIEQTVFDLIESDTSEQQWQDYFHYLLPHTNTLKESLNLLQVWGGLPEVITLPDQQRLDYLANYTQTYLEKDVRAIHSISDLNLYRKIMDISAEQTGSLRDDSRILNALGCHRTTLNKYRDCLSATLMFKELYPYINSSLKRLVKSPKGYLINNGLISYLMGIDQLETLQKTGQIGHRLENWFLNELAIWLSQTPQHHEIYFWRTSGGAEVDFIVKKSNMIYPFEVTHHHTIEPKKVRNLTRFLDYEPKANYAYYIYMGEFTVDHNKRIIFLPAWSIC